MKPVSHDDVTRLLGALDDHTVAEIVASGATLRDLETVASYLALETDVMGEVRQPLTGRAGMIYEAIRRAEETPDE